MTTLSCVKRRARHDIITAAELRDLGLDKEAVRHLVRRGDLLRLYRGAYSTSSMPSARGFALAAVLSCGDHAALADLSAAALWEVHPMWPEEPQVAVANRTGAKGPRGVQLRHTATLETTTRDHIPVTTLPRTVLDASRLLPPHRIKALLRQAERLHRLDLTTLEGRMPQALRAVLRTYVPAGGTESELEAAFLEICARAGLPRPETQVLIGPYRVDFLWRHLDLIVEVDGRGSHDTAISFVDDRARDRALKAMGFDLLRFASSEVFHHPDRVAAELSGFVTRAARRSPARAG